MGRAQLSFFGHILPDSQCHASKLNQEEAARPQFEGSKMSAWQRV